MEQGIQRCWAPENLTGFRHVQRVGRDGGKVEKEFLRRVQKHRRDCLLFVPRAECPRRPTRPIPCHFTSVRIGGGGYVSGLFFHLSVRGLYYARTDMDGDYGCR
jgi:hypothetical protein